MFVQWQPGFGSDTNELLLWTQRSHWLPTNKTNFVRGICCEEQTQKLGHWWTLRSTSWERFSPLRTEPGSAGNTYRSCLAIMGITLFWDSQLGVPSIEVQDTLWSQVVLGPGQGRSCPNRAAQTSFIHFPQVFYSLFFQMFKDNLHALKPSPGLLQHLRLPELSALSVIIITCQKCRSDWRRNKG